jgi:eukaryotic-like serine/threonine-protein kinase
METKDLPRIEHLFHTALTLDAAERSAYLARECAGEDELYAEVESLLAVFEKRADFLEKPAFSAGLKVLVANASESLAGKLIGSYKLVRLLGKGGMGEVYLAQDTRLGRQVALKFLARHLAADNWAKRQLIKEARAVAMLDHPNICTVHGLEEADGHSFIVMQYLEGEVLADFIHEGRLDGQQALSLALQMVDALAQAHAHGIIHRDIKPRNLILIAGSQLKVLDFGLAKVVQTKHDVVGDAPSQASQSGLIMGTVAYMSPEQLRGERLDFRSDIFSVGTVLYELVSGKHPFAQRNEADTIAAILTGQPPSAGMNGFPYGLELVIRKCLEKDKERRYQSASELLIDLQNLQAGVAPRSPRPRFNPLVTVLLLVLLIAGAMFAYSRLTAVPTLAILPFVNEGAEAQLNYLIEGLPESVANQLVRLSKVKVKAATITSGSKGPQADPVLIGRELNADAVLVGKATAQEHVVTLHVRLVKTSDGSQLWVKSYDLKQTNALALPELVAAEVAAGLHLPLSQAEEKLLQTRQTAKTEAFHEYLRGRYYWNWRDKENIQLAISHFERAIKLDPAYARAYTGLSDSYILLTSVVYGQMQTKEAVTNARAAVKQALEIDDTLPEAHTSLGVIKLLYDWDWDAARDEFKRALALNPGYAPAHYWYSNLLIITGQAAEGVAESEIARELDPLSPTMNLSRCRAKYWTRQFESSAKCFEAMLQKDPANARAQYILGLVYRAQGRSEKAIDIFQKLYEKNQSLAVAALGYTYGKLGRRDEALRILSRAKELAQERNLPSQEIALIHLGIGDHDKAIEWLEKAYDERFAYLIYLTVEPLFDPLHGDTRFADLARRLNLQPPTT